MLESETALILGAGVRATFGLPSATPLWQAIRDAMNRLQTLGAPAWRVLEAWPQRPQAWGAYTLNGLASRVALEDRQAAPHFTAMYSREVDRAYLLAAALVFQRASADRDHLSVLDFGGATGAYHHVACGVAGIPVDYTVQELDANCEAMRPLRPPVRFVSHDRALAPTYGVVLASGALQYLEDWRGRLRLLAKRAEHTLFISRAPVLQGRTVVVQQRMPGGTNVGWMWNRDELVHEACQCGLSLADEFHFQDDFSPIPGLSEVPRIRGFAFRRQ
jgi:putative methyltransferase (TIGR04325 family)